MGVDIEELTDIMNENIEALNSGIDAAMFTMGADAKVHLAVTPADPKTNMGSGCQSVRCINGTSVYSHFWAADRTSCER